MKKKYICRVNLLLIVLIGTSSIFSKRLKVVTTSKDLASIASEIGKNLIEITSLAGGGDDLHFLHARPDYILKTSRANVVLLIGADLEVGWLPLVLKNSRNAKVQLGQSGYCDVSRGITLLEKQSGLINRQMGDVHAQGNPHYWIDPLNGIRMAKFISNCFSSVDKSNASIYKRNFNSFRSKVIKLTKKLLRTMKPHFGKKVIVYHREFSYFVKRFRLNLAMHIEDKPGASPSPGRVREVIEFIRKNKIKVILTTPWNNIGVVSRIARESGTRFLVLPMQTGAAPGTSTYLKMIEKCIQLIDKKLQ